MVQSLFRLHAAQSQVALSLVSLTLCSYVPLLYRRRMLSLSPALAAARHTARRGTLRPGSQPPVGLATHPRSRPSVGPQCNHMSRGSSRQGSSLGRAYSLVSPRAREHFAPFSQSEHRTARGQRPRAGMKPQAGGPASARGALTESCQGPVSVRGRGLRAGCSTWGECCCS